MDVFRLKLDLLCIAAASCSLVGLPIREIERDLILETLVDTDGNRTASARLLAVPVRTLRNKITEYAAEGVDVPRHETRSARGASRQTDTEGRAGSSRLS